MALSGQALDYLQYQTEKKKKKKKKKNLYIHVYTTKTNHTTKTNKNINYIHSSDIHQIRYIYTDKRIPLHQHIIKLTSKTLEEKKKKKKNLYIFTFTVHEIYYRDAN
jgi:hypothetical protein